MAHGDDGCQLLLSVGGALFFRFGSLVKSLFLAACGIELSRGDSEADFCGCGAIVDGSRLNMYGFGEVSDGMCWPWVWRRCFIRRFAVGS